MENNKTEITPKVRSTFSSSVLDRFMTAEEKQMFVDRYAKHVKFERNNRFIRMVDPITPEEQKLIDLYFNKGFKNCKDIAEEMGGDYNASLVDNHVRSICKRKVYQTFYKDNNG